MIYDFNDSEMEDFLKSGDFFKLMVNFSQQQYLLTATAPGKLGDSEHSQLKSLQAGHTYSILKVREVYSHKLLNIRNLWGHFDWDGAWSRKSAFWTPDLRDQLNPSLEDDDGTFWISYEDFINLFSAVNVTKVHENMNEIRLKGQFMDIGDYQVVSKWYYYIETKKKTQILINIQQQNCNNYLDCGVLIFQKTAEGTCLFEVQDFLNGRDCIFETILPHG